MSDATKDIIFPDLAVTISLSTLDTTLGETFIYKVELTHSGTVTIDQVFLQDLLTSELKFLPGSVTLDGKNLPHASIISGITLNDWAHATAHTLTFEVLVIANLTKPLELSLSTHYTYHLEALGPIKLGSVTSNRCTLNLHYVSITLTGSTDESIAFLDGMVHYHLVIENLGDTPVYNIILTDQLASYPLVENTFEINNNTIHSASLENGIHLGFLAPKAKYCISYALKITEKYHPLDKITSLLSIRFAYTTHDHNLKYSNSNTLDLSLPLALSTFQQFTLESYFEIAPHKLDLETINDVTAELSLINHYIIDSPKGSSLDGQKLTGHLLVIHGLLELTLEYCGPDALQGVYSSFHILPFSTLIVLPGAFPDYSHVVINSALQNVSYHLMSNRNFYASACILLDAHINK